MPRVASAMGAFTIHHSPRPRWLTTLCVLSVVADSPRQGRGDMPLLHGCETPWFQSALFLSPEVRPRSPICRAAEELDSHRRPSTWLCEATNASRINSMPLPQASSGSFALNTNVYLRSVVLPFTSHQRAFRGVKFCKAQPAHARRRVSPTWRRLARAMLRSRLLSDSGLRITK